MPLLWFRICLSRLRCCANTHIYTAYHRQFQEVEALLLELQGDQSLSNRIGRHGIGRIYPRVGLRNVREKRWRHIFPDSFHFGPRSERQTLVARVLSTTSLMNTQLSISSASTRTILKHSNIKPPRWTPPCTCREA